MAQPTWTIQGFRGAFKFPVESFDTKAKAVRAMEQQRQPKTAIVRDEHHYIFTRKEE